MPPQFTAGLLWLFCLLGVPLARAAEALPNTQPLTIEGDLAAGMVEGVDRFLSNETGRALAERQNLWHRDFSSAQAYEKSVETNRQHLRQMIGAVDERLPTKDLELIETTTRLTKIAETDLLSVQAVRWPVFDGVFGEGLRLVPRGKPVARVVAIPDADQTPEMLVGLAPGLSAERQFARRLAEHGCEVLVPVLIDRQDQWSGNARLKRVTNQPHREWIYRQAFPLGRHIIGYEVQKVIAAVGWLKSQGPTVGVAGYGEGGLIAFYAAALEPRINAALVSGYFDSRQQLWTEPIYRNVFGLLREFGDAELASLIAPRALIVEHSPAPKVDGPPAPAEGRKGAAPGQIKTPDYVSVETEFERAGSLLKAGGDNYVAGFKLITGTEGATTGPGSDRALIAFVNALGISIEETKPPGKAPSVLDAAFDAKARQQRQVHELEDYTQTLLRQSEQARRDFFWKKLKAASLQEWESNSVPFKKIFWEEVIGRLPPPALPPNPRTRKSLTHPKWDGYEVMIDVFPDVFAWGYLLVPKDVKPGERRPVVVCQHGLEGRPPDVFDENPDSEGFHFYRAFAARLVEAGFVVLAPQNLYRGKDKFRQLQRKANPLKQSLFSVMIAQHSRLLEWLAELPFVDPSRIGFYGLSYGGKTAMRVPAVLDRYALSICSADFNEWVRKLADVDLPGSYLYTDEYEMPEFNLANTFNYAEMAALIAPRPFMVERGHNDPVGQDEWVAYEYAKVRRLYDELQIHDRTAIEFFNGGHAINGVSTFEFLQKHLNKGGP
jgi:dienelactone hydrolase